MRAAAQEALEGWLEAHLVDSEAPPRPRIETPLDRRDSIVIHVPALSTRWVREAQELSQRELAERVHVTHDSSNRNATPELGTIENASEAVGFKVDLTFSAG